ncbi:hypothetical protein ALQ79_200212 [Pseudomonas amygdali pv. lachrymans]|nr:hypothetical protein ALQ79_200212 [Pseudomonas amygdali pv. lachrymans]
MPIVDKNAVDGEITWATNPGIIIWKRPCQKPPSKGGLHWATKKMLRTPLDD